MQAILIYFKFWIILRNIFSWLWKWFIYALLIIRKIFLLICNIWLHTILIYFKFWIILRSIFSWLWKWFVYALLIIRKIFLLICNIWLHTILIYFKFWIILRSIFKRFIYVLLLIKNFFHTSNRISLIAVFSLYLYLN